MANEGVPTHVSNLLEIKPCVSLTDLGHTPLPGEQHPRGAASRGLEGDSIADPAAVYPAALL